MRYCFAIILHNFLMIIFLTFYNILNKELWKETDPELMLEELRGMAWTYSEKK